MNENDRIPKASIVPIGKCLCGQEIGLIPDQPGAIAHLEPLCKLFEEIDDAVDYLTAVRRGRGITDAQADVIVREVDAIDRAWRALAKHGPFFPIPSGVKFPSTWVSLAPFVASPTPSVPMRLEQWSCHALDEYKDPRESMCVKGNVYGHPTRPAGDSIRTSKVVNVDGRRVETASGSVYILGEPSEDFAKYCESIGKPIDPVNPIKTLKE